MSALLLLAIGSLVSYVSQNRNALVTPVIYSPVIEDYRYRRLQRLFPSVSSYTWPVLMSRIMPSIFLSCN